MAHKKIVRIDKDLLAAQKKTIKDAADKVVKDKSDETKQTLKESHTTDLWKKSLLKVLAKQIADIRDAAKINPKKTPNEILGELKDAIRAEIDKEVI